MNDSSAALSQRGSGLGAKMAGGNPDPERGREPDDFYATPAPVTLALAREYRERLAGLTIWEPCAGDGSMAAVLSEEVPTAKIVCSDIKPRPRVVPGLQIGTADVLGFSQLPAVDAVITNPPFSLAAAIISHIMGLPGGPPQLLALVLKSTYWHASTRQKLFKQYPPTAIHPLTWRPDFKMLGAPTMEMMWCVWDRRDVDSEPIYVPLPHPNAK